MKKHILKIARLGDDIAYCGLQRRWEKSLMPIALAYDTANDEIWHRKSGKTMHQMVDAVCSNCLKALGRQKDVPL